MATGKKNQLWLYLNFVITILRYQRWVNSDPNRVRTKEINIVPNTAMSRGHAMGQNSLTCVQTVNNSRQSSCN